MKIKIKTASTNESIEAANARFYISMVCGYIYTIIDNSHSTNLTMEIIFCSLPSWFVEHRSGKDYDGQRIFFMWRQQGCYKER